MTDHDCPIWVAWLIAYQAIGESNNANQAYRLSSLIIFFPPTKFETKQKGTEHTNFDLAVIYCIRGNLWIIHSRVEGASIKVAQRKIWSLIQASCFQEGIFLNRDPSLSQQFPLGCMNGWPKGQTKCVHPPSQLQHHQIAEHAFIVFFGLLPHLSKFPFGHFWVVIYTRPW